MLPSGRAVLRHQEAACTKAAGCTRPVLNEGELSRELGGLVLKLQESPLSPGCTASASPVKELCVHELSVQY